MIEEQLFSAFPFPCLLVQGDSRIQILSGGSLFPPPSDATTQDQIKFYTEATLGWSTCPLGYAVYATNTDLSEKIRIVVFGTKVRGVSSVRGKADRLNILTDKSHVEACVKKFLIARALSEDFFSAVIGAGVHEIRNINKDIYNAIYSLKEHLENRSIIYPRDLDYAKNIEALSELLRIRSDAFDVISNPSLLNAAGGKFPVYRAFDRIQRSLTPSAESKDIHLKIQGSSTSRTTGIKLFDVIPYVLIQNAIKYAPKSSAVTIDIRESATEITVNISSLGPPVEMDEKDRIFSAGYRGRAAKQVESQGSGIGLFFAKKLVELHDGASISFFQDPPSQKVSGIQYCPTYFNLRFRIAE